MPTETPCSWQGKRVFLTGHTGFKGGWLALWLAHLGAEVRGYSLDPYTTPNLLDEARISSLIDDVRGDIRDAATLEQSLQDFAPEVVFHLAAQPLVRLSYADPIATYETNVIGTARLLEAVRGTPSVRAVVVITTDKVLHRKQGWPWVTGDRPPRRLRPLLVLEGLRRNRHRRLPPVLLPALAIRGPRRRLATARAGNVIGGGDWSARPPHPRPRPRLPVRRPRAHPPPARHPPLAARARVPARLPPPRRTAPGPGSRQPTAAPSTSAPPSRRPTRRLDRRPASSKPGAGGASWFLDESPQPPRGRLPHASTQPRPCRARLASPPPARRTPSTRSSTGTRPTPPAKTCRPSPSPRSSTTNPCNNRMPPSRL